MPGRDFRVSHFFEWEKFITGGQAQSVRNQRKILENRGIDYTTSPDLDADILHLNNMGPRSIYYARKASMKDVPVVIHTHQTSGDFENSFAFSSILSRPMEPYLRYAYSLGDQLICPSEFNRREIPEYSGVEKNVISNGYDPGKLKGFESLREEYLERYDLEPPVIFCVGHVLRRKGLRTFIETARQMPELDFAWFGYINPLGEGRIGKMLQSRETMKMIEESPENCTFTGYIDDIRGAHAAGDIFFFPTRNENEGIALLEAMSAGKPVVVRDIETFEWLEHGENCLKAENDFSGVIKQLMEPETREELGEAAKQESRGFTLEKVGDQLLRVYKNLV